ncbi:retrotransposon protein, putative, ty1-copia subclass [Tanacetum coccineum]
MELSSSLHFQTRQSERRNQSAARILKMIPTKKDDKTPYELWYGKVHNLSYLKIWGCEALVKRDTPDKLQQRSVKCIFIGYPKETMGYYFYFTPENKIVVASKIPMEVEGFEPPQEEVIPIHRSERTHRAPNRLCLNVEAEEHNLGDLNEPTSYKAAMLDPESNKWLDAVNAEMQSMIDNKVFVDLNHPRKVCKLQRSIYGLKQASRSWNERFDEEIKRFGFTQNLDESCVYQKASGSNGIFLILYADDIIIMGNHIPSLQSVNDYLGKYFVMKDLGEAAFILEIKIYRDRNLEAKLRVDFYCNAGFETDRDEIKSQTVYVFILNGRRSRLEKFQVKYYCNACCIS